MRKSKRMGIGLAVALIATPMLPATMAAENIPENTIQADSSQFIALGKVVQVNVGDIEYKLDFPDNKTMTFTGIGADSQDNTDTVEYTAIKIRPQVYMVYWHEPKSGDNVVHIEDYLRGEVYTNIASKDGGFTHLKGRLKIVGRSEK